MIWFNQVIPVTIKMKNRVVLKSIASIQVSVNSNE